MAPGFSCSHYIGCCRRLACPVCHVKEQTGKGGFTCNTSFPETQTSWHVEMCGLMISHICCQKPWYLGHDMVFWGNLVLLVVTEQLTEYVYAHGLLKIPITFTSNPSIHRVVVCCAQWHTYTTSLIFFQMIINPEHYLNIFDKSFNLMGGWLEADTWSFSGKCGNMSYLTEPWKKWTVSLGTSLSPKNFGCPCLQSWLCWTS